MVSQLAVEVLHSVSVGGSMAIMVTPDAYHSRAYFTDPGHSEAEPLWTLISVAPPPRFEAFRSRSRRLMGSAGRPSC
jgi:hypothetical protein